MQGGGQGAYIGNIHRLASRLDCQWQLVAGAFDVDPERGRALAISQGLDPALTPLDGRVQIIKRGADDLSEAAKLRIRTPPAIPRTIWKSLPTSMPAWPR
ncbi:hypothetical protein [Paracoccus sp. (in: a-proteobacteria)]|uniref:hypothetical protein n=1 Tax=Paracoccus sp. TaxID=267 RepID=UPI0035ADF997